MQRGGGHRDLPEAREEPLQEAVHATRHHAEVQVSKELQVTGTVLLIIDLPYLIVCSVADPGSGAFLSPGSGMEKTRIRIWCSFVPWIRDPE